MTLRIEQLRFAYTRARPALRDVTMHAAPGQFVAVVGPNGAGKSTLLRLAAGLLRPGGGRALIEGVPAHRLSPSARARRLAYIPQRPTVAGDFTARQIVALGRFALPRDNSAIDRALETVRLADRAQTPFNELSAGQQQRAAIARALAQLHAPDVSGRLLIADEPIAALDPAHATAALAALHNFTRRGGAVLASLHDLTAALRWADHVLALHPDGAPVVFAPAADALTPETLRAAFGAPFAVGQVAGARIITTIDDAAPPRAAGADTMTPAR